MHHGSEELVPHLDLHDGPAQRGHGSLDVQLLALKCEATAIGLLPHKAHLLFVVVHLFVQTFVDLFALVVDSYGEPVLVHVIVVGHREHYSYCLFSSVAVPLKQVVCQDAHRTGGFGAGLAEVAHLGFQWAHGGLGWAVAVATVQVNPFLKAKSTVIKVRAKMR